MQLLTTNEVAKFLNVSRETVNRLRKSGELKSTKVGGQYRFRSEDIEAYLNRP
jgi:excisionase family DNA binding protein